MIVMTPELKAYWSRLEELDRLWRQREELARKPVSADVIEAYALHRLEHFTHGAEIDRLYREYVHQLALYFAQDPAGKIPSYKGVLLTGGVGSGKTTLFKAFDLTHHYIQGERILTDKNIRRLTIVSCNSIARAYADEESGGVGCLTQYFTGDYVFDDLGSENASKYYGKVMDVMGEIIQERYNHSDKIRTYVTTNLCYSEIEKNYGQRVASRLCEMCSWFALGDEVDYRRKYYVQYEA